MTLTEHQRQLVERLAQTNPRYAALAGVPQSPRPVKPAFALSPPCTSRGEPTGEVVQCPTCRGTVSLKVFACAVSPEGCTLGKPVPGKACCEGCTKRTPPRQVETATSSLSAGVVIGCYGLPKLARLQVRAIRATCGNVPVLLADDSSGQDAEFRAIEKSEPDVTFWPSDVRRGHYAGDLSVYWKGLQWAHTRGFRWLCKLSQRFLWTRMGWLAAAVGTLAQSGQPLLAQRCMDNGGDPARLPTDLKLRTESMLFDVPRWVEHFRLFDRPRLGQPTELYVWDLVHRLFAGEFAEWVSLTVDRYTKSPGTIWHASHTAQEFQSLGQRIGLPLDRDFTVDGWQSRPNWLRG